MTQPTALFLADILEDAGKPADVAEKCAVEMRRLYAQRDALLEALKNTVPALIRLGDFVGNTDDGGASGMGRIDRCDLLLQVHNAITAAERTT